MSYNIDKGIPVINIVKDVYEGDRSDLITLTLKDSSMLTLTSDHPIYVKNKGWINSINLKKGDFALSSTSQSRILWIEIIGVKKMSVKPAKVYNINRTLDSGSYFFIQRILNTGKKQK